MCMPLSAGRGVEAPAKFSKKAGLKGSQFLEGISGKEGGDLFQGELQFLQKKEIKIQPC